MRGLIGFVVLLLSAGAIVPPAAAAGPFSDWAAVVVAGDWRAPGGAASEGFDNARRDVSAALERLGFAPENLRQFSVRPERYTPRPGRSQSDALYDSLVELTGRARGGCLAYFSSHGSPEGVALGADILTPGVLAGMLDTTCGERPTIVVVSACFSGVFIPALAGANRVILTAARADRASFGCGQSDRYPYFDDCFLRAAANAREFVALAEAARTCVAAREQSVGAQPPSEPQFVLGAQLAPLLPLYAFSRPPGL